VQAGSSQNDIEQSAYHDLVRGCITHDLPYNDEKKYFCEGPVLK
jgi:hypothetical protein